MIDLNKTSQPLFIDVKWEDALKIRIPQMGLYFQWIQILSIMKAFMVVCKSAYRGLKMVKQMFKKMHTFFTKSACASK